MFDLHLFPASSGEEYFVNTPPIVGIHDGDGTPISAHPQHVPPDCETRDCEECTVV